MANKRKATDDIAELLAAPADTKKVAPFDPTTEQVPRSATLSKEWKTQADGKVQTFTLVTEPFKAVTYLLHFITDT